MDSWEVYLKPGSLVNFYIPRGYVQNFSRCCLAWTTCSGTTSYCQVAKRIRRHSHGDEDAEW